MIVLIGYDSPYAELIEFDSAMAPMSDVGDSGCNCHLDVNNAAMPIEGGTCTATTGHASENPFYISAPSWTWG